MTGKERQSCIITINTLRRLALNIHGVIDAVDNENCDRLISLLESGECEDAISREDTLTRFCDYVAGGMSMNDYDALYDIVETMPSVYPKQKKK